MALIEKLTCSQCDFATEETAGAYLYTVGDAGEVIMGHPAEGTVLKRVTGLEWHEAREKGLIRTKQYCLCYACSSKFYMDIDRLEKKCPTCQSSDVRSFNGAIAASCPSCRSGTLVLQSIGIS